jgi:hypothetical protein
MKKEKVARSKIVVIDADITQAAGKPQSTDPRSRKCRNLLYTILEICHRASLSPDLLVEWKEHSSKYARQWHISMHARKKIIKTQSKQKNDLRHRIEGVLVGKPERDRTMKDFHLVEAALDSDCLIFSMDETAYGDFCQIADAIPELQKIMWINPIKDDDIVNWLQDSAPHKKEKCLSPENIISKSK